MKIEERRGEVRIKEGEKGCTMKTGRLRDELAMSQ